MMLASSITAPVKVTMPANGNRGFVPRLVGSSQKEHSGEVDGLRRRTQTILRSAASASEPDPGSAAKQVTQPEALAEAAAGNSSSAGSNADSGSRGRQDGTRRLSSRPFVGYTPGLLSTL